MTVTPVKPSKKHPSKKHPTKKPPVKIPERDRNPGWVVCGFDTSASCIAGAAIGYDRTLRKYKGPVFTIERWQKEMQYLDRIRRCAYSYELVQDLVHKLGPVSMKAEHVFIGQEEPWPLGMAGSQSFSSGFLKQQAEISGAFLAGALRFGYVNVVQMNSIRWRKTVADDMGISTHHTKWQDPALCEQFNCIPKDTGKFRSKQWALGYAPFSERFKEAIPDLPDIIERKEGKIPRPEGSTARAVQAADEYDALAICWTLYQELNANKLLA